MSSLFGIKKSNYNEWAKLRTTLTIEMLERAAKKIAEASHREDLRVASAEIYKDVVDGKREPYFLYPLKK